LAAKRTGMAWETRPIPAPRIGQIGQKYLAPAELVRGPIPLVVACANGWCCWGGRCRHGQRLLDLGSV
jgi:hypothetical protein